VVEDQSDPASVAANGPQLRRAIPILRIFSVDKAMEFYLDFLGDLQALAIQAHT
jgi:hypothetical protein